LSPQRFFLLNTQRQLTNLFHLALPVFFVSLYPTIFYFFISDWYTKSVEEIVEQQHELTTLSQLLATLPDRERELIALKYGSDLTNRAIAKITGLSESNVGTILHRVVGRLREKWEDCK